MAATGIQINGDGTSNKSLFPDNLELITYGIVGVLGALIWDIFNNLQSDYELIRRSPTAVPTIVYFLSRITTLLSAILMARFSTAVNVDCTSLFRAAIWTFAFGISLTTLLFVFRARAVYQSQKWAANLFFVLWLGVVAAAVVEIKEGNVAMRQEPSGRCITVGGITPLIIASAVIPTVNDIVIFCAITWKLVQNSHEELTLKKGLVVALFGRYLPALLRTLLRDGQEYFLATIIVSLATNATFIFGSPAIDAYSALLASINAGVMHLMACKIYRETRLGTADRPLAMDSELSRQIELRLGALSNIRSVSFGPEPPITLTHHSDANGHGNNGDPDLEKQQIVRAGDLEVDIAGGSTEV